MRFDLRDNSIIKEWLAGNFRGKLADRQPRSWHNIGIKVKAEDVWKKVFFAPEPFF